MSQLALASGVVWAAARYATGDCSGALCAASSTVVGPLALMAFGALGEYFTRLPESHLPQSAPKSAKSTTLPAPPQLADPTGVPAGVEGQDTLKQALRMSLDTVQLPEGCNYKQIIEKGGNLVLLASTDKGIDSLKGKVYEYNSDSQNWVILSKKGQGKRPAAPSELRLGAAAESAISTVPRSARAETLLTEDPSIPIEGSWPLGIVREDDANSCFFNAATHMMMQMDWIKRYPNRTQWPKSCLFMYDTIKRYSDGNKDPSFNKSAITIPRWVNEAYEGFPCQMDAHELLLEISGQFPESIFDQASVPVGGRVLLDPTTRDIRDQSHSDLVVIISRFVGRRKDDRKTSMLEIFEYQEADGINNTYELDCIIDHQGRSANSGHYIAYKKIEGDWYKFDDQNVEKVQRGTSAWAELFSERGGALHFGYIYHYKKTTI
ncbi:MAG: hypothetical protein JXA94_03665 [Parachlamydiales bacterium]|nr:hypothetical protein [Parachlamydiales bacterium]